MHCLQILCSWLIFDKLTNCEIAEIDFALLPKPASKAINQSKFFQIRVNSGIYHTALDSVQLMKMHGKAASGDLINFSKVSITFPAGIENLITGNIFNPPFHMSSFIRCRCMEAFTLFPFLQVWFLFFSVFFLIVHYKLKLFTNDISGYPLAVQSPPILINCASQKIWTGIEKHEI